MLNLIKEHKIDIRFFDPKLYPELEGCWMAGYQKLNENNISTYYTAFGNEIEDAINKVLQKIKIEYTNWCDINSLATKQKGKWSVYISNGLEYNSEEEDKIWKFVIEQLRDKLGNELHAIIHGGLFFFESKEEAYEFFDIFQQPLTESSPIYAVLYDDTGECITENT